MSSALPRVRALRYVTPLREGGSLPAVMEADDDGTYVVKFRGAGQGLKVLVAEVITSEIARVLDIPTPELVVVTLDEALTKYERDEEVQDLLKASVGTNLGSDFLPGSFGYDGSTPPTADLAARIVAPWPGALYRPAWLERYGDRVSYVGGISRHTVASGPGRRTGSDGTRRVVLVGGAGGSELTAADLTAARDATPGWSWTVAGPLGEWHADVETLLRDADVAVIAAGQNSVADVAAAGCRAIVVPQPRPYDEQRTTARVLARTGLAVVRERWPQAHEWPQVLDRAAGLDPHWERWRVADAARRAAQAVIGLCA